MSRDVRSSERTSGGEDPVSDDGFDGTSTDSRSFWGGDWSSENWIFIGFFVLLATVTVAFSTSWGLLPALEPSIPPAVYLYSTMGALGYAFTKLITGIGDFVEWGNVEELIEMALRIPAAWVLAAGVFLLSSVLLSAEVAADARLIAGVSFLVGLYVNVAFESLGALADRLLAKRES